MSVLDGNTFEFWFIIGSLTSGLKSTVISLTSSTEISIGLSVDSMAPLQPENTHPSPGIASN